MHLFPTIKDNFTTLLRAGAFGIRDRKLDVMSNFKWSRIEDIALQLRVPGCIANGVKLLEDDGITPQNFMQNYSEISYSSANAHLCNRFKQKAFERICDEEPHDMAASMETLALLRLIVSIGNDIVETALPLPGIITLGRFLRNDGDKVDFVKLENWIKKLGIMQLASLQASLLIELFDFEKDEFPYIKRFYSNAIKHYNHLLENAISGKLAFASSSKLNIAMLETSSLHFGNFCRKITDVQE